MAEESKKKKVAFRSFAVSLAIAFSILVSVSLFIVGGVQAYLIFFSERQNVIDHQSHITEAAASQVKDFVKERITTLETATAFGNIIALDGSEQERILNRLLGIDSSFRQIIMTDKEGNVVLRASRLSKSLSAKVIVYNKNELLRETEKGSVYISPVYIDITTNEPLMVVGIPISDVFGDLEGTLIGEVNLKFTWNLVSSIKIGEGGFVFVVDRNGSLIASKDISRVLRGEKISGVQEIEKFVNNFELSADSAEVSRGIDGTYVMSTQIPLGNPDWAVIAELPLFEAYENVFYGLGFSALVILLAIAFSITVSVFLSKKITEPISRLREVTKKIREGNFDAKATIDENNEVGELAQDFNSMAERLRAYTQDLEKKVIERTGKLNIKIRELIESNRKLSETQKELKEEKEGVERKILERTKELREEQARLLASINSLSIGFILADLNNEIVLKNAAVSRILDISEEDVSLDKIAGFFEKTPDFMKMLGDCMKEKKVCEFKEVESKNKIFRIVFAPIAINETGEIIGYVLLLEDVTEPRTFERTRDEFFLIASHELRTPLTAIRGNAEIMEQFFMDKINEAEVVDMVEDIRKASVRLIAIVNDFLDVSRIEQHKIKLEISSVPINKEIKEAVKGLFTSAEMKGVKLIFSENESLGNVMGDEDRIEQVLVNIIGNAINYTHEGFVKVVLEKEGDFAKVSVIDTGVGIPHENQKYLFKKFQQAGTNILARDVTKGTGLGLYISRLLVEDMGGEIWLEESGEGKGSTFSFTLPLEKK